jgi:hypothetical protein
MDVTRHKRPLRDRLSAWWMRVDDATSTRGVDIAAAIAAVVAVALCAYGLLAAFQAGNDPDYNPPRNAYYIGGVR